MTEIILTIVIFGLLGLLGYREVLAKQERDELTRKIMARNYFEYMSTNKALSPREEHRLAREYQDQIAKDVTPAVDETYKETEEMTDEERDKYIAAGGKGEMPKT